MNLICSKCKIEKSEEDFHRNRSVKSGRNDRCKTCRYPKKPVVFVTSGYAICTECKCEKLLEAFSNNRRRKTGKEKACKVCCSKQQKAWREENADRVLAYGRNNYKSNSDKILAKQRATYRENPKKFNTRNKAWAAAHSEQLLIAARSLRNKNRDRINSSKRKRYKEDPQFRMANALRRTLNNALKGKFKTGSAVRDMGCSIDFLVAYFESLFLPEGTYSDVKRPAMDWNNYGSDDWHNGNHGWHIDHIKPLDSFKLTNREELLKACHYMNLQPKWGRCNIKKGNK